MLPNDIMYHIFMYCDIDTIKSMNQTGFPLHNTYFWTLKFKQDNLILFKFIMIIL